MKIAITADLHLCARADHPERLAALANIFAQLRTLQIDRLVIAGDLHDAQFNNFSEFEALCRQPENRAIQVLVIPGNHDPNFSQASIAASNVRVFSQPERVALDPDSPAFLFVPYRAGQAAGDAIAAFSDRLQPDRWLLVGHGDWMGNTRASASYEPGVYMPLSQRDIDTYRPARVFLGHIHAPYDGQVVRYPGSPCGMDITETGRRRFLVYDTLANSIEERPVDTEKLFFNATFTLYPVDDEAAALEAQLRGWIASWKLYPAEKPKARVRVKLNGFTTDKHRLLQVTLAALDGCEWYADPDLSELSVTTDLRRGPILDQVRERLDALSWSDGPDEPGKDQMLLAAIKLVYGG